MSTPGTAPNVSLLHEPRAPDGLNPRTAPVSERPVPVFYVLIAALGWLAAGFSFWHQSTGQAPPPTPPGEEREKAEFEVNATKEKLATARSALAVTTRLRDEAVQALQEVREGSAQSNKELATARSELDDIRQKIAAQSSELATITKRLDTARLRQSVGKMQGDANLLTPVTAAAAPAPVSPAAPPAISSMLGESAAAVNKDLAAARGELDAIRQKIAVQSSELATITKRLDMARTQQSHVQNQADASAAATAAIQPAPAHPLETPPKPIDGDASPTPGRDAQNRSGSGGPITVIGPGAPSYPSDFELRSGRISRTP